jgi:hypothetical protein
MLIQSNASQLAGDAKALKIRVSTQMDITAEHAGTDKGEFQGRWVGFRHGGSQ